MSQGRITFAELGNILDLSAPAAADRVRRLEEKGVIKGYAAIVNPDSVGCGLTGYITVTLERPEHRESFLKLVRETPAVQECHHITGDEDYILKVRCAGISDLENLVSERLKGVPGLLKTRTNIVMSTVKDTTVLPLPAEKKG